MEGFKPNIQFREVQQFRQGWLWYLLISGGVISLLPIVVLTISGEVPVSEGMAIIGLVLLITLINLAALYVAKLEIIMNGEGIAYRWWPFFRKFSKLSWKEVEYIKMGKYSRFQFGAHRDKQYGKVHNVDGSQGYQVVMQNGRRYFFGTQKKLSVETVLQQTGKLKL
jgi:hypothetical protein